MIYEDDPGPAWRIEQIEHHSSDGLCAGDERPAVKAPPVDSKASVVLPTKACAWSPKEFLTAWSLEVKGLIGWLSAELERKKKGRQIENLEEAWKIPSVKEKREGESSSTVLARMIMTAWFHIR